MGGTYLIQVADNDFTTGGEYSLQLTGYPEITVLWAAAVVADGDWSPTPADGTDFGGAARGGQGPTRTYTVRNTGNVALVLGAVSVPAGFQVVEPLDATLAPGRRMHFRFSWPQKRRDAAAARSALQPTTPTRTRSISPSPVW